MRIFSTVIFNNRPRMYFLIHPRHVENPFLLIRLFLITSLQPITREVSITSVHTYVHIYAHCIYLGNKLLLITNKCIGVHIIVMSLTPAVC